MTARFSLPKDGAAVIPDPDDDPFEAAGAAAAATAAKKPKGTYWCQLQPKDPVLQKAMPPMYATLLKAPLNESQVPKEQQLQPLGGVPKMVPVAAERLAGKTVTLSHFAVTATYSTKFKPERELMLKLWNRISIPEWADTTSVARRNRPSGDFE